MEKKCIGLTNNWLPR